MYQVPQSSKVNKDFQCPVAVEIPKIQVKEEIIPSDIVFNIEKQLSTGGSGAVRIPPSAVQLQVRLCIIAHCRISGHRGIESSYKVLEY